MTHKFRYVPPRLVDDVQQAGREFLGRLDDGLATLDAWRGRVQAAYEDVEAREAAEPDVMGTAGFPEDAPPQYTVVQASVEGGKYTWDDVMSGDVTDPDARAVHVWLDSRVDLLRRAWQEIEHGANPDEAVDTAAKDIERERKDRS